MCERVCVSVCDCACVTAKYPAYTHLGLFLPRVIDTELFRNVIATFLLPVYFIRGVWKRSLGQTCLWPSETHKVKQGQAQV